jgi:hypothetical protein
MLETVFWQRAAASLPAQVRSRYALELHGAERFERRLGRAVRAYHAVKAAFGRWFDPGVALKPRSHP